MKHELLKDLGHGIKAGIVNITPEQAGKMLEKNDHNRALPKAYASAYAFDMIEGYWQFNGVPIIFADDGTLLDGQTRLNAIIIANISQDLLVITGINNDVFKSIDTGKGRKGIDVLTIEGLTHDTASLTSTLIVKIVKTTLGANMTSWSRCTGQVTQDVYKSATSRRTVNNAMIVEYYQENKTEIDETVSFCLKYRTKSKKILGLSVMAFAFWHLRKINLDQAEHFYSKLSTGENLNSDDPIYALREKLMSIKNSSDEKVPLWHYPALIFKAWSYYRRKVPLRKLFISKKETKPCKLI